MAFTIEQIEGTILSRTSVYTNIERLRNDPDYFIILNYLTGQTSSMPSFSHGGYGLLCWHDLVNLLQNIETPSANDQLILDVVSLPELSHVQDRLKEWLDEYLINHMSTGALQAVMSVMKHAGISDDMIFAHLLFVTAGKYDKTNAITDTPLLNYLAENVRKRDVVLQYKKWSSVYFRVLEMEKPALLKEYMLAGIMWNQEYVVDYLVGYHNGKYIADILDLIDTITLNERTASSVMDTTFSVYEQDTTTYASFVVKQAIKYLDLYQAGLSYESRRALKELEEPGVYTNFPYSTCACYLLFKYEKTTGIEKYQQILKHKRALDESLLPVLFPFFQSEALSYLKAAILNDKAGFSFTQTAVTLLTTHFEPAVYLPVLWSAVGSKLKGMRNLLVNLLVRNDADAAVKAIALLEHKKKDVRLAAAAILSHFNNDTTKADIG